MTKKKWIFLFVCISLVILMSQGVLAADDVGNQAGQDFLGDTTYQGAISSIKGITDIIDKFFTMFISIVAFFIILTGLAKNVVAGAYYSWPSLWDKVHAAHVQYALNANLRNNIGSFFQGNLGGTGSGFGAYNQPASQGGEGVIAMIIYRILPDFKGMILSDQGDESGEIVAKEPKQYFLKAIPQMVFIVFIGIFIYNGFYRDVTLEAGDFGSEAFRRIIMHSDPMAMVDKAIGMAGTPDFGKTMGVNMQTRTESEISKKVYQQTVAIYSDLESASIKNELAMNIQNMVTELLAQDGQIPGGTIGKPDELWEESKYDVKYTVTRVSGLTKPEDYASQNISKEKAVQIASGVENYYRWYTIPNIKEAFNLTEYTMMEPDNDYSMNIQVRFARKSEKIRIDVGGTSWDNGILKSRASKIPKGGNIEITVTGLTFSASGTMTIDGAPINITSITNGVRFTNTGAKDVTLPSSEIELAGVSVTNGSSSDKINLRKVLFNSKDEVTNTAGTTFTSGMNLADLKKAEREGKSSDKTNTENTNP